MPKRISEEAERIIIESFNKGLIGEQIALLADVHLNTVYAYLRKYKLRKKTSREKRPKFTPAEENKRLEERLPILAQGIKDLAQEETYADPTQRAIAIFRAYNHRNGNKWKMVKCDFFEDHSFSFCTLYQNTQNPYLFKIHLYQDRNLITEFNVRDGEKAVRVYYNMIPYFSNALAKGINTAKLQKIYENIKKRTYRPSKGVDSD